MIIAYFILAILCAGLIFFLPSRSLKNLTFGVFLVGQVGLNTHAFLYLNEADSGYFVFDSLGLIFLTVLTIIAVAAFYHSYQYHSRHHTTLDREGKYLASMTLFIAAMSGTYFAEHLGLMWALIEATTLSVAVLIYHERTSHAVEATWKYIFLCSVGITIAFAGILFMASEVSSAGATDLTFNAILAKASAFDVDWMKMSFLLVLMGFSVKMGVFPFHTVSIDAQTVAPQPVNALLSTTLKNVGFLGVFRVYAIVSHTGAAEWVNHVLLLTGLITLAVAALQMSKAIHISRILGYSSIEHMGIVSLGLAAGGIGYYAAILHCVLHSFVKSSLFFQNDQLHQYFLSYRVNRLGNYLKINPSGAGVLMLGFLGITALPPSGLFVTELMVFQSLFQQQLVWVAVLAFIFLTMILYYFGKNMLHILFDTSDKEVVMTEVKTSVIETLSQYVLLGLMIYLAYAMPPMLSGLIQNAVHLVR